MKFFKLVKKNKKINILLSGGTSVEKYLNIFLKSNLNWNNIRFYLTDERLTTNKTKKIFFFIKKIFFSLKKFLLKIKLIPKLLLILKILKTKKNI